jgi:membrane associated rhomboid family serine protease
MTPTSVGMRCPECSREKTRVVRRAYAGGDPIATYTLHLLFNMYALYILGQLLEPALGRARFLLLYFVSLIAGSVGALILDPNALTAGASGAVFGLMGAAILVMRNRGINVMESGLGVWLGLNLLITFTVSNISVGGHIGGLIGGGIAAWVLVELPDLVRIPRWSAEVAAAVIGVAAFAVAVAIS